VVAPERVVAGHAPGRQVVRVPGDHSLRRDHKTIAAAFTAWLDEVLA